ncbi:MAG: 3-deoxy-manno-octulosonate cytidylyltransferase [Ferruginibacter sp.]|nr:3-deoxy-manno-octulosonate cytidylyltransferase [Cytophagales bacterium]
MNLLGIIPARYASTRFPAKALADIAGKSMIRRVYEQVTQAASLSEVLVATDHPLIYDHVAGFGGKVVMTSEHHPSGTDRCFEAQQQRGGDFDYVINIQGDEPFIRPEQVDILAGCLNGSTELATLVKRFADEEALFSPHTAKVVLNQAGEAMYFSRQALPFLRGVDPTRWLEQHPYYQHVGIYAYRTDILARITQLPPSGLEKAESLEQLRWLENGYRIRVAFTEYESAGIDTPEDLAAVLRKMGWP